MAWPPDERPHYERLLTELPEAMGPADVRAGAVVGAVDGAEQVTAFALEGSAIRIVARAPGQPGRIEWDWYRIPDSNR